MLKKITQIIPSFSLIILGLIFHCLPLQICAANIHAIIVADTNSTDITQSVTADVKLISDEIKLIAHNTNLHAKVTVLMGKEVNSEKLVSSINNLSVQGHDLVFFYFTGHGYRTPSKQQNPWPNLYFSINNSGIDVTEIFSLLAQKNPRLLIAIADCCNNSIPDDYAPILVNPKSLLMNGMRDWKKRNYRKLFLKTKGQILISSSKEGEFAWGASNGAIFTIAFLKSLHSEIEDIEGEADWQTIIDSSIQKVHTLQTPQYQIISK